MAFRLTLTGVGAMNSPRFAPAGLLVEYDGIRVVIDGGGDPRPFPPVVDAWLVSDDRAELIREIRELAGERGVGAGIQRFAAPGLILDPMPVIHTSHPTYGYSIRAERRHIVWAPEFCVFPEWAASCDLMFAEAAGWDRPIHFAGRVGGHASAVSVSREARELQVRRLIFAHLGRPTIRACDRGERPPFGSFGYDGARFEPRRWRR
ncbi:MAG: hypothetical protein WED83_03500 [Acidimicrobiia bacterium]